MKYAVAAAVMLTCPPLAAAPPRNFDARIESVRRAAGTPGMAVAIVENGKVVLAKGYGVRKIGDPAPVDADTVFMIGSTGKAFTSAALATLVDAGKLDWDDRVVDRLPGFEMYDAWVTREMRVRDLLVHRSGLGLGAGDLLYVPRGSISRAELVRRLRYIKPATSFRSAYAYDNILYAVAGQLIEAVSGQTWEDYVREHLFAPAGMTNSITDDEHHFSNPNRAFPHGRVDGPVRGVGEISVLDERDQLGRAAAPAGMIGVSANDMAKWLQIQLAHGALPNGGRLFSETSSKAMWEPVTPMPIAKRPGLEGMEPEFQAYALGWEVRDYHGTKIVWHSGGLFGFTSIVVLIPEKNIGFAIEVNSEELAPRVGLMYELLDHYTGRKRGDWPARFAAWGKARTDEAIAVVQAKAAAPAKIGPSLPLARYAGTYADPWYGNITVAPDANGLSIDFTATTPGMRGRLEHWQYDSFIARFSDKGIEPAYVTFALDADGKVQSITMKPVSPIADFSFDYADLLFTPVAQVK